MLVDVGGASGDVPKVTREQPEVLGAQGEQSRSVDPSAVFEVPEEGLPGARGPGVTEGDDGGCRDGRVDELCLAVNPLPRLRRLFNFTNGEADVVLCVVE